MDRSDENTMTFWDHLEALRLVIFKILGFALGGFVIAFALRGPLFKLVLAPSTSDFLFYSFVGKIGSALGIDISGISDFQVDLFSTTLTAQFMIHMKMAFLVSLLIILPYSLYLLMNFIKPALYEKEKRHSKSIVCWSYILFMLGATIDYIIIFPLAFRFLGTYQVSPDIPNIITLESYTDMLVTMTLLMGILFELPVISWLLGRIGVLNAGFMKKYRRHAIVIILGVAAIITPTTDMFTLTVVTIPIYLLYELSIALVPRA